MTPPPSLSGTLLVRTRLIPGTFVEPCFLSAVDTRLPFQAEMFIQNVILVFFCLGVISCVFPWFLVAVGPLVLLFAALHSVSRVFIRELKRLDNVTMSPFLSHITSSVQGLATLQAYDRGHDFLRRSVVEPSNGDDRPQTRTPL